MSSLNKPEPVWGMVEWDTLRASAADGSITLESYDSEDNDEVKTMASEPECDSDKEAEPNQASSSSSVGNELADFKMYNYMHAESERDYILADGEHFEDNDVNENGNLKRRAFSDDVRIALNNYYKISNKDVMSSLHHATGSYAHCPKGHLPDREGCKRRKYPGPFITCAFANSHESGDEFVRVPMSSKSLYDMGRSARPPQFREKKTKYFTQCKNCETVGFMHHRNPSQHYEDYVNNVTYKSHNNQGKIWQQHLADLKYSLDSSDPQYDDIIEKTRYYKPSSIIIYATRYSRPPAGVPRKKTPTAVLTRKRTTVIRRPGTRMNTPVSSSKPPSRPQTKGRDQLRTALPTARSIEGEEAEFDIEAPQQRPQSKNKSSSRGGVSKSKSSKSLAAVSATSLTKINKTGVKKPGTAMQERMKVSMTKLINARHVPSKISKTPVKPVASASKRRPPPMVQKKEAKYIQKLKPNISAKFLRRKSKSNANQAMKAVKKAKSFTAKRSGKEIQKVIKTVGYKSQQSSPRLNKTNDDHEETEDGSYAQFRDRNGNFDTEKYRQSILKMLENNSGSGAGRERKKKGRGDREGQQDISFAALPKVKNIYRDIKSKTTSNVPPQRKRKKKNKKTKTEQTIQALFEQTISDISLKSKFSNEKFMGRYSVPDITKL